MNSCFVKEKLKKEKASYDYTDLCIELTFLQKKLSDFKSHSTSLQREIVLKEIRQDIKLLSAKFVAFSTYGEGHSSPVYSLVRTKVTDNSLSALICKYLRILSLNESK